MRFTFTTRNSTYEVDEENSRIRRLTSNHAPTPYQGPDGEWKDYEILAPVAIGDEVGGAGYSFKIYWDLERSTITSPVMEVSR